MESGVRLGLEQILWLRREIGERERTSVAVLYGGEIIAV